MTFAILKSQGLIVEVGTSLPSGTSLFTLSELGVERARRVRPRLHEGQP